MTIIPDTDRERRVLPTCTQYHGYNSLEHLVSVLVPGHSQPNHMKNQPLVMDNLQALGDTNRAISEATIIMHKGMTQW